MTSTAVAKKTVLFADRKEALEDAHLAALLKVKKASLSVAELELAMAKITATINDYTTALKRAQACSQKSVPVNESTKTAFESLQKELQVLACNLKVKKIEERIAKLNEKEHRNRLKAIRREEECGSLQKYVAFLTERKKKSYGTAHINGIGWKLYVPGMTKKLDSAAAEREPEIFPADIPSALVELANIRTRSLTIFFALARLFPPAVAETPMFRGGHLEVHVAGADWSEGRSVDKTAVLFLELLHLLRVHYGPRISSVEVVLVGPHIEPSLAGKTVVLDNVLNSKDTDCPLPSLTLRYCAALYHDFNSSQRRKPSWPGPPHMVVCFNAGIWGYEEWKESIVQINSQRCPLLITSYNMHECFEDQETLEEWGITGPCWAWEPELNPFRSLHRRRSGATSDNCYWQCVWMGMPKAAANEDTKIEKFPLSRGVNSLKARAMEIMKTPTKRMKTSNKITSNKINVPVSNTE